MRWRSRPGAEPNLAAFDRNDAEAVRRRRATANRVLTYLKAALNLRFFHDLYALRNRLYAAP